LRTRCCQNEYNRACFEINCGNPNKARELLRFAIENNQINPEWLKDDPDWENVKNEQWFIDMLNISQSEKIELDRLISEAAIRRKLDEEEGITENFFSKYDIIDPKSLASKLSRAEDPVSKYLKDMFTQDQSGIKTPSAAVYKGEMIFETPMSPCRGSHGTDGKQDLSTLKFSFPWETWMRIPKNLAKACMLYIPLIKLGLNQGVIIIRNPRMLLEKQMNSKEKTEKLEKKEKELIELLDIFLTYDARLDRISHWLFSVPAPNGLQHTDYLELFNPAMYNDLHDKTSLTSRNRKLLTKTYAKEISERRTRSELCETIREKTQNEPEYIKEDFEKPN